MNDFSHRLNIALDAAGMTQSDLANRLGIKPQSVQKWCAGGGLPRAARFREIATAVSVSEAWLATGAGEIATKKEVSDLDPRAWLHAIIDESSNDTISVLERLISISTGKTRKP